MPKVENPKSVPVQLASLMLHVLVLFLNPASLNAKDSAGKSQRDSTPWFVTIPCLNVSVMARDSAGNPITGYWDYPDAQAYASALYIKCMTDKEFLKSLREMPEQPSSIDDGYKLMHRLIAVPEALK